MPYPCVSAIERCLGERAAKRRDQRRARLERSPGEMSDTDGEDEDSHIEIEDEEDEEVCRMRRTLSR